MIQYLKHHQIDYERWDMVIQSAPNSYIYAFSWYLDFVSPGWDALVEDNYTYIMPLPVKSKYGIYYLSQPLFAQQLGIFSINPISQEKVTDFLKIIPHKFIRCNINLNYGNPVNLMKPITNAVNYVLPLSQNYQKLFKSFNENTKRNIKKALLNNLSIATCSTEKYIEHFRRNIKKPVSGTVFSILRKIVQYLVDKQLGKIYTVNNSAGECIAGIFLINSLDRIIYLVSFSSEEGKEKSAMFLIVDFLIQKYQESNLLLDFEGSSIPGIARFFEGFGASKTYYPIIRKKISNPFNDFQY